MTDHFSEYGLHLNGAWYSSEDLLKYCHEILNNGQSQDWELNIAKFIMEWYDQSDFIEVKTSGSTGQPQILSIKKEFAVNSALSTLEFLGLKPGDSALLCLPANFIAGKMMIIRSIIGRLKLTSVEPKGNVYDDVSDTVDFAAMIPLQVQNLLESPGGSSKLKQIRKLIIGGAAIPPALEENLRTQNHPVYSTYGMTETISHIAMRRIGGAGYSRYYQLLPNISIDKDKDDCLIVNAPFLSENIVHTKDVVRISQNNEFEIQGSAVRPDRYAAHIRRRKRAIRTRQRPARRGGNVAANRRLLRSQRLPGQVLALSHLLRPGVLSRTMVSRSGLCER